MKYFTVYTNFYHLYNTFVSTTSSVLATTPEVGMSIFVPFSSEDREVKCLAELNSWQNKTFNMSLLASRAGSSHPTAGIAGEGAVQILSQGISSVATKKKKKKHGRGEKHGCFAPF